MKEIILTRGFVALVDNEDYADLSAFKWQYCPSRRTGYAMRRLVLPDGSQTTIAMHRELMKPPDGMQVDHINGNGLDNRRSNLRVCTQHENAMHRTRTKPHSSIFKGVHFCKALMKWQGHIRVNKRKIHLGSFDQESEAVEAYNKAALEYFGSFAACDVMEVAH